MLKPRRRAQSLRYWESLSDEQLIETELMTDDPEALDDLVQEVPPGDEEPHVEFKYDLRGSGRQDEFTCVHGHHKHLAGFVMRKGDKRFLVGWMCGASIYGEDFEQYTADFDAAVVRRDALRRVREVKSAVEPFIAWLNQTAASEVFKQYESVEEQMAERMPWIWENLPALSALDSRAVGAQLPRTLFHEGTDPETEFKKLAAEFNTAALKLAGPSEEAANHIPNVRRRMEALLPRMEEVLDELREVEDLFQPVILEAVCRLATQHDNPKKRKYRACLGSITLRRDKKGVSVHLPRSYKVPDRGAIARLRAALAGAS
jgi:hypothetical protein